MTVVSRAQLKNLKGAAAFTHLGFTLAGSILGLFFLGYWIDGLIGTRPWLAITGAFLGATGGFINLIRSLNVMQEENERREKELRQNSADSGTADSGGDSYLRNGGKNRDK